MPEGVDIIRVGRRVLLVVVLLLSPSLLFAQAVQNPTLLVFTPSPDHATIASYQVRILGASGQTIQTLDIGKPDPCSATCPPGVTMGEASAMLNVQPITFGTYTIVMTATAGGVTGPASVPTAAWERVPGPPSGPRVK